MEQPTPSATALNNYATTLVVIDLVIDQPPMLHNAPTILLVKQKLNVFCVYESFLNPNYERK